MFVFKKLVSLLLNPMFLFAVLLVISFVAMLSPRFRDGGRKILIFASLMVLIFSIGPFARLFLEPLEWQYPPVDQWVEMHPEEASEIKHVVVLSAGSTFDPELSANNQLGNVTLARLIEGIRIYRQIPSATLILSGGNVYDVKSVADIMAQTAIDLGVPIEDIIIEADSRDTKDQAVLIADIIEANSFYLVTSATHMPRSMQLMQGQGLKPVAAPAEYFSKNPLNPSWRGWLPSVSAIDGMQRSIHEYVGMLWARLRGQIKT